MATPKVVRQAILDVVDRQIRDLNPPETKETFDRLLGEGITPDEARRLIAYVRVSSSRPKLREPGP